VIIHPAVHPLIYPIIYLFIHSSNYLSIHSSIYLSIHSSIHISMYYVPSQSTHLPRIRCLVSLGRGWHCYLMYWYRTEKGWREERGEMDGSARWGHLVMMTISMTLMMIYCGWCHQQSISLCSIWPLDHLVCLHSPVCIDDEESLGGTPGRLVGLESYQAVSASPKPATRGRHCDGIDPTSTVVVVVGWIYGWIDWLMRGWIQMMNRW